MATRLALNLTLYTNELQAELAPYVRKMEELQNMKFSITDRNIESTKHEYESVKNSINRIKMKHGIFVEPNAYNSDKAEKPSDRYSTFRPNPTYTFGDVGLVWDVAPSHLDSCYDMHDWLVKIGAISKTVSHDHESGGLFYYFRTEKAVQNAIARINRVVAKYYAKL